MKKNDYIHIFIALWLMGMAGLHNANAKIFHPENAMETAEVWGDLIVRSLNSSPKMTIQTEDQDIVLNNVHTHREGCMNGTFLIQKDSSKNGHILLDVISCEKKLPVLDNYTSKTQSPLSCPKIYAPVCGLISSKGYSDTRSFTNLCELNNHSGQLLKQGPCEEEALK